MSSAFNLAGNWQGVSVLAGQILEAIGIQLLYKSRGFKSLFGRFISVLWGLLLLTVGFLMVFASIEGKYKDIDKAIVLPLVGSLIIIGAVGSILKMLTRLKLVRQAQIRDNWQMEWLRKCVQLTNPNRKPDSTFEFDHYSALVHLFDTVIEVCKPRVNRALMLSLILIPFYLLFTILQRIAQLLEDLMYFAGRLVFTGKVQWKRDDIKMPFVTDNQLDAFDDIWNEVTFDTHREWVRLVAHEDNSHSCKECRNSWAQCISSLHVANVLSTTPYSGLLRRSMLMETREWLHDRIKSADLRLVSDSCYGRRTEFLTFLSSNSHAIQGEEPGLQLVWNVIICNEEVEAPCPWAKLVLLSVEEASKGRLKTTSECVIGDRELHHVAKNHEKWFIDVAMYCWWNMTRCAGTDQMVDELITSRFENYASVIISTAETILQRDYTGSAALVAAIGPQSHSWLMHRRRQHEYWTETLPVLPPSGNCYGVRTLVEALGVVQEGLGENRKEAYALVAVSLWLTVAGKHLTLNECEQVVQLYNDPIQLQDLVASIAKAYWKQTIHITPP